MAITFVGSTSTVSPSSSSTITLTKPTGVTAGDFMLGYVAAFPGQNGSQTTVNVPSGWTKVRDIWVSSSFPHQLSIMWKIATASEPSTWTGSFGSAEAFRAFVVVAYRGPGGILVEGPASAGATNSYNTATVNNTQSSSWRVEVASYTSATINTNISINDAAQRELGGVASGGDAIQIVACDSNAAVVSGNTYRTVSRGGIWDTSAAWIAMIQVTTSGTLDMTVPDIAMSADGTVSNDAVLDMTAPFPTMTMDGIFIDNIGGPMVMDVAIEMAVAASVPVTGTLEIIAVSMEFTGETAPSGPRVAKIQPESRTYYPVLE